MTQLKVFPLTDEGVAAFNKFASENAKGESSVKYTDEHVFIFYEVNNVESPVHKINALRIELKKHLQQALEYEVQIGSARIVRDTFKPQSPNWNNQDQKVFTDTKMLQYEKASLISICEILKGLGEEIELPEFILGDMMPKKAKKTN